MKPLHRVGQTCRSRAQPGEEARFELPPRCSERRRRAEAGIVSLGRSARPSSARSPEGSRTATTCTSLVSEIVPFIFKQQCLETMLVGICLHCFVAGGRPRLDAHAAGHCHHERRSRPAS